MTNPLTKMLYSPSQRVCWEVTFNAPDDDHPDPWVYDFVSVSWPSDWTVGPSYPYNTENRQYRDVYDENGVLSWEEVIPDPEPEPEPDPEGGE